MLKHSINNWQGSGEIITEGKKTKLVLDQKFLQIWHSLNPTEQYFTLLESWLFWGDSELLGESRMFDQTSRCLFFWENLPAAGLKFNNYLEQEKLSYYPGFHNLTLLHLFGLIELISGKPQAAKGWRFTEAKLKLTISLFINFYISLNFHIVIFFIPI